MQCFGTCIKMMNMDQCSEIMGVWTAERLTQYLWLIDSWAIFIASTMWLTSLPLHTHTHIYRYTKINSRVQMPARQDSTVLTITNSVSEECHCCSFSEPSFVFFFCLFSWYIVFICCSKDTEENDAHLFGFLGTCRSKVSFRKLNRVWWKPQLTMIPHLYGTTCSCCVYSLISSCFSFNLCLSTNRMHICYFPTV